LRKSCFKNIQDQATQFPHSAVLAFQNPELIPASISVLAFSNVFVLERKKEEKKKKKK